ncbi:hypothetical protein SS1G_07956 [Sclerotinia sclerotiorum 1980 UF-70]|uniref:Conserved oligomeric Golgi complex subunit 6 n=1 Tax=Sclerotinia sclerotiorum (strain ATCC 18683 / 1980 / Ss-1) TaxID=665079 RepID=COG6_SCLS1|nr:hypothetical protein SS1G_07956 [Sclerotinia sclerotiorum 1980 UF-70]A7ERK2.1 RecName: Full=Conserved oligomeric Golgi complex subunit 6; Short=COG complex subunit 6; AltName: Full=Component of oligomeric Golgi complex 6 [Sclerotinia sclerotiorum 1980 UF-70]EDN92094.1 hypothetical protein SS1G_07956 [Sclerotinia sclerotiorum 1980 UF-70]
MTTDYFTRKQSYSGFSDGADSPGSPLASRTNPLSSKVTSVLSASYADSDIRDALSLLDKRGIQNTAETRRQLRLDVHREVIESNGDIIREFGHVAEEASELMKQQEQMQAKQELLNAFNAHFVMSDDDIAMLTSTAEPVNDRFFSILSRAKKIQNDCEILLGTENQRLGLEIMEQTSKNINGAFQKLYRWIQREFKTLNLENPQISSSIRRALRVLAERPSLFQSCLDFFAEARENILSDGFYTALTGTTVGGDEDPSIKPIELVAHDPLRYVGDMLAWTHSATVGEREALEVLFISDGDEIAKGIQAGLDSEPWNRIAESEDEVGHFDGLKALNELVDRDVAGVARVLRQKIGQVIQSHEETIMAYKIANLLNFYRGTFQRLLGDDSVLLDSLATLEESALRQFRALMRDHITSLQAETQVAPPNLSPPDFLHEGLKQLTAIMKTYETSFTSPETREAGFEPILTEAFDPFMKGSENVAKDLSAPRSTIFTINCLLSARATLAPFDFTISRVSQIKDTIEEHAATLIDHQYIFFLEKSALQPLLQALSATTDIRDHPVFQPASLIQASQTLDDFLPSALMDAMENLKDLQNSMLVRQITEEAAEKFCDDFEKVEERLMKADEEREESLDEKDGEPHHVRALYPRTGGEIRVLLSIRIWNMFKTWRLEIT